MFQSEEVLVSHSVTCQNIQVVKCDKCPETFESSNMLALHMDTHEDSSLCKECSIKIKDSELNIKCNKCGNIYHKKCTNLRKVSGYWKPSTWMSIM